MTDQILYGIAVLIALLLIYHIWFRPEYLTDDEIAQSLLASAMISNPIDSTALIKSMPLLERKKYEHLSGLPYNPNYYQDHMSNKFVMSMNA